MMHGQRNIKLNKYSVFRSTLMRYHKIHVKVFTALPSPVFRPSEFFMIEKENTGKFVGAVNLGGDCR